MPLPSPPSGGAGNAPAPADPQWQPIDPTAPTDAPPGSPGKLLVMEARASARLALFHARDAPAPPGGVPLPAPDPARAARPPAHRSRKLPRGVSWDAKKQAYRARTPRPARLYLGLFDDPRVAGRAVRLALAGDVEGARALARRRA